MYQKFGIKKEILDLSDLKKCVKCNEPMDKNAKFCPKCGEEQPAIEETPAMEVEVVDDGKEATEEKVSDKNEEEKPAEPVNTNPVWDGEKAAEAENDDDSKTE